MTAPAGDSAGAIRREDDWVEDQRSIGGLLTIVLRTLVAEFHGRLDNAGYPDIRPGSGNVFESIGSDGSTVAAMAQRAGITAQAMVQVVDYLESRGYVERTPDPTDRRAKVVRLTERGRAGDHAAREQLLAIEDEWSRRLGHDRYREFRATLAELAKPMETPS
jgi:DNA-binding MarR family transcriptional regulator